MRHFIIGACALLAAGSLSAVGCSSDDSEGGEGGATTTPTGVGGGGGTGECLEITSDDFDYMGFGPEHCACSGDDDDDDGDDDKVLKDDDECDDKDGDDECDDDDGGSCSAVTVTNDAELAAYHAD